MRDFLRFLFWIWVLFCFGQIFYIPTQSTRWGPMAFTSVFLYWNSHESQVIVVDSNVSTCWIVNPSIVNPSFYVQGFVPGSLVNTMFGYLRFCTEIAPHWEQQYLFFSVSIVCVAENLNFKENVSQVTPILTSAHTRGVPSAKIYKGTIFLHELSSFSS